ncbi:MAG: hypothetical protein H5T45_01925 [Thermoplasmatales archaeon]|nr:hypothetical protein [Thermoplasmatales archaeon]
MVVKDKVGRQRYILFTAEHEKVRLIKEYKNKLKLIFYDGKYGLVKCSHLEKEKVINFLNSIDCKTLYTSGTIKKIRKILNNFSKDGAS